MTFRLMHGQQAYGKAILADVRKSVSGAFVETNRLTGSHSQARRHRRPSHTKLNFPQTL